jgi:hypothetical protein
MSEQNKPVAKVQMFPLSSAIWRHQNQKGVFYSATFERSYRDEAGKWQSSSNFNAGDCLLLSKLADVTDSRIRELRAADRQSEQHDEEAA